MSSYLLHVGRAKGCGLCSSRSDFFSAFGTTSDELPVAEKTVFLANIYHAFVTITWCHGCNLLLSIRRLLLSVLRSHCRIRVVASLWVKTIKSVGVSTIGIDRNSSRHRHRHWHLLGLLHHHLHGHCVGLEHLVTPRQILLVSLCGVDTILLSLLGNVDLLFKFARHAAINFSYPLEDHMLAGGFETASLVRGEVTTALPYCPHNFLPVALCKLRGGRLWCLLPRSAA